MTASTGADTPGNDIRHTVSEIAQVVLDREKIDEAVDLFDQGATSLAFIRIVAQLNERYGITVDVQALEEASIDSLSALIGTQLEGKPLTVGG
jgi:acyl carrier protein